MSFFFFSFPLEEKKYFLVKMTWFRILERSRGIWASVFTLPWQGQASIKDLIKSVSSCIISNPGAFAESWKCAHMATTDSESKGDGAVRKARNTFWISCKGDGSWKLKETVAAWPVPRNTLGPSLLECLLGKYKIFSKSQPATFKLSCCFFHV